MQSYMNSIENIRVYRGSILHCLHDPSDDPTSKCVEYFEDGILIVSNGKVHELGFASELLTALPENIHVKDYTGNLIVPGFIDTHIHCAQTDIIGSYGEQLLQWLDKYTFPAELKFEDADHSEEVSEFFMDELLKNGTTSAMILPTVHSGSVDAIFYAAKKRSMRVLAGKVLMDRNAPEYLCDTPELAYYESKSLIERWHGTDRLSYAVTPRFAPTSTDEQLKRVGDLVREYPGTYLHTHVAENKSEIDWVAKLFPWSSSYLDVYDYFGLLRERSVFAHCLHLTDSDYTRMADTGAAIAFCPTSNTFLGSGLFDLDAARNRDIKVGLATDVGGGTSFSMIQTMSEAYKVLQLRGQKLSVFRALYLATLGGAEALCMDDKVGNFIPGKEADFVVLNFQSTPLMARRISKTKTIEEKLFAAIILGDDRLIQATYIMGEAAYKKTKTEL